MNEMTPALSRRMRGQILMLLRARHNSQQTRFDDVGLTHALRALACTVSIQDVVTLLQDLADRKYVRYRQTRDSYTGRVYLERIELTSAGRDQAEENVATDPAVEL